MAAYKAAGRVWQHSVAVIVEHVFNALRMLPTNVIEAVIIKSFIIPAWTVNRFYASW